MLEAEKMMFREKATKFLDSAKIFITEQEAENIIVEDFGLGKPEVFGVQMVFFVDTERCGAKEVVLFPNQAVPEHVHPDYNGHMGKEETFRCRWGKLYMYIPGNKTQNANITIPVEDQKFITCWHELVLYPGDQYTIYPNTLHWFHAGEEGAVFSEFSTKKTKEYDLFTSPHVKRKQTVEIT